MKFCRDVPDQDVSVTWIVLSNTNRATVDPVTGLTTAPPISGAYTIKRGGACSGFTGTITRVETGPEFTAGGPFADVIVPGARRQEERWVLTPQTTRQVEAVGRDDRIFNVDATWSFSRTSTPSVTFEDDFGCTTTITRSVVGGATGQGAVNINFFAPFAGQTPAPRFFTAFFAIEDHTLLRPCAKINQQPRRVVMAL